MQSIKQNQLADVLPDFRSLGVVLRTVLLVNGGAILEALIRSSSWREVPTYLINALALVQPILLISMLLMFVMSPLLTRMSYPQGVATVLVSIALATLFIVDVGGDLYAHSRGFANFSSLRYMLLSMAVAGLLLMYFRLRAQALSPALHEAKLQALQARIRPHFLFNCINTVLSIMRGDPKRAETALEDMSDLFRMAMAHDHQLVALQREMELSRRYLDLEKLRLGDRLQVNWKMENMPEDAMIPPLMLQPLLENAVYHGIEPLVEGGVIDIRLSRHGNELEIEIRNPRRQPGAHHMGNKLALANIRERLALQFDIEAHYEVESGADFYRVHIVMPYVKQEQT